MSVSVIIGGQWGSEGKGKVTYFFTKKWKASSVVRVGGANSGHTIVMNGVKRMFQVLPVSSVLGNVNCILPAGSYIDLDILKREIEDSGISEKYLKIHPNAVILTSQHRIEEKQNILNEQIGSTESGTGAAVIARISRKKGVLRAAQEKTLEKYLCDTTKFLREELHKDREVIIEGTQGFGLSLLHSSCYPFVTSRDTSAAGFLSESGLSPFDVRNIVLVLRAFPIRVAGKSGPLPKETSWENVTEIAGSHSKIREYTTVTKRIRRVAYFDSEVVQQAIECNRPNIIVLNHCDYFDAGIYNQAMLSQIAEQKVQAIEREIGRVDYIGTGDQMIFER